MRRAILAMTAVLAVLALSAAPALAGNSPPPGNDHGLPGCEPSNNTPMKCNPFPSNPGITVVTEPPGANCPAGGVKITVPGRTPVEFKRDGDHPSDGNKGDDHKPPVKPPADQVFFVCNGVNGAPGAPERPERLGHLEPLAHPARPVVLGRPEPLAHLVPLGRLEHPGSRRRSRSRLGLVPTRSRSR